MKTSSFKRFMFCVILAGGTLSLLIWFFVTIPAQAAKPAQARPLTSTNAFQEGKAPTAGGFPSCNVRFSERVVGQTATISVYPYFVYTNSTSVEFVYWNEEGASIMNTYPITLSEGVTATVSELMPQDTVTSSLRFTALDSEDHRCYSTIRSTNLPVVIFSDANR